MHARRHWVDKTVDDYVRERRAWMDDAGSAAIERRVEELARLNRRIHEIECVNLNPATNVMNPRAEALLSAGLGTRPSLGYPTQKYEMGLEAIEEIEVIAAALACEIFEARHAEIRVASGAMANLYAFMATTRPGEAIIVPPASLGGHVTHHEAGAAGLYGLRIFEAPVAPDGSGIDLGGLARLAHEVRPRLITIGGSLNLFPWDVAGAREVADDVSARLLFDAAHLCGMIAGRQWENPLGLGADIMTMSTYKSLGGPPGGLLVTNDDALAERLEAIAYPGLTANFDASKAAALAVTLLDWRELGEAYARAMVSTAAALAASLLRRGVPVHGGEAATSSHQFAIAAHRYGGGQTMAMKLRRANILSSGIGLPLPPVEGDLNGLRLGTPEIVRWGMDRSHMEELAALIADALASEHPERLAEEVTRFRSRFTALHFIR